MEGAALAAERQFERDLLLAWHTAAFNGAASVGKLKPLAEYRGRSKQAQTPAQMLGALRVLQDMGAPMTIRQVH